MINKIKIAAAIILLISLVLPLSQCNYDIRDASEPKTERWKLENQVKGGPDTQVKYFYAGDHMSWDWGGLLILLAFVWPLPVLIYRRYGESRKFNTILLLLEPVFCLWSATVVYAIVHFGSPTYPGYLALLAVVAYFLAALAMAQATCR